MKSSNLPNGRENGGRVQNTQGEALWKLGMNAQGGFRGRASGPPRTRRGPPTTKAPPEECPASLLSNVSQKNMGNAKDSLKNAGYHLCQLLEIEKV